MSDPPIDITGDDASAESDSDFVTSGFDLEPPPPQPELAFTRERVKSDGDEFSKMRVLLEERVKSLQTKFDGIVRQQSDDAQSAQRRSHDELVDKLESLRQSHTLALASVRAEVSTAKCGKSDYVVNNSAPNTCTYDHRIYDLDNAANRVAFCQLALPGFNRLASSLVNARAIMAERGYPCIPLASSSQESIRESLAQYLATATAKGKLVPSIFEEATFGADGLASGKASFDRGTVPFTELVTLFDTQAIFKRLRKRDPVLQKVLCSQFMSNASEDELKIDAKTCELGTLAWAHAMSAPTKADMRDKDAWAVWCAFLAQGTPPPADVMDIFTPDLILNAMRCVPNNPAIHMKWATLFHYNKKHDVTILGETATESLVRFTQMLDEGLLYPIMSTASIVDERDYTVTWFGKAILVDSVCKCVNRRSGFAKHRYDIYDHLMLCAEKLVALKLDVPLLRAITHVFHAWCTEIIVENRDFDKKTVGLLKEHCKKMVKKPHILLSLACHNVTKRQSSKESEDMHSRLYNEAITNHYGYNADSGAFNPATYVGAPVSSVGQLWSNSTFNADGTNGKTNRGTNKTRVAKNRVPPGRTNDGKKTQLRCHQNLKGTATDAKMLSVIRTGLGSSIKVPKFNAKCTCGKPECASCVIRLLQLAVVDCARLAASAGLAVLGRKGHLRNRIKLPVNVPPTICTEINSTLKSFTQ